MKLYPRARVRVRNSTRGLPKSTLTNEPHKSIWPLSPPQTSGPRCASRPLLVVCLASPSSTPDAATRFFPAGRSQCRSHNPIATPDAARTTPAWSRPAARQQPPRPDPNASPSHVAAASPWLSRQTCWLYVNMCVIVKFETYLAIKLLLYSWI
jgi:hypothetical protein